MPANMRIEALHQAIRERILVLDGAMGTMLRRLPLTESDWRGPRFAEHAQDLKGMPDVLVLTRPDAARAVHEEYLAAGADIITTNSFNANATRLEAWGLAGLAREINVEAARLARAAADAAMRASPGRRCWVAGSIGPANRRASPAQVREAYREAAVSLMAGGVDMLLIETVTEAWQARAALGAIQGLSVPVIVAATVDRVGRLLDGKTVAAYWADISEARPFAVGVNCAFGTASLRAPLAELARSADTFVSVHPNAGLPDARDNYPETPSSFAQALARFASEGLVDIAGGCCGTTPEYTRAIVETVKGIAPRRTRHDP